MVYLSEEESSSIHLDPNESNSSKNIIVFYFDSLAFQNNSLIFPAD